MDEESPEQRQFYGYIREYTVSWSAQCFTVASVLEYLLFYILMLLFISDNVSSPYRLIHNILHCGQ